MTEVADLRIKFNGNTRFERLLYAGRRWVKLVYCIVRIGVGLLN